MFPERLPRVAHTFSGLMETATLRGTHVSLNLHAMYVKRRVLRAKEQAQSSQRCKHSSYCTILSRSGVKIHSDIAVNIVSVATSNKVLQNDSQDTAPNVLFMGRNQITNKLRQQSTGR